jgi:small multidrug resistance pump
MMHWLYLALAIGLDVSGTTCMKLSRGFTRLLPSALMVLFYGLSWTAGALALKKIDVSVAYAIWAGLGTALVATVGMLWLREPAGLLKGVSIGLIVLGIVGLNLSGGVR